MFDDDLLTEAVDAGWEIRISRLGGGIKAEAYAPAGSKYYPVGGIRFSLSVKDVSVCRAIEALEEQLRPLVRVEG